MVTSYNELSYNGPHSQPLLILDGKLEILLNLPTICFHLRGNSKLPIRQHKISKNSKYLIPNIHVVHNRYQEDKKSRKIFKSKYSHHYFPNGHALI